MSCVAITLGPLSKTMEMTTSPAGLWAASGIFSYLAENICRNVEKKFADAKIVNPVHTSKDGEEFEISKDGIGKYHDRIFFFTDEDPDTVKNKIDEIKETVIGEIADGLSKAINRCNEKNDIFDFLKKYLIVHYVIDTSVRYDSENNENYIIKLSPYLDCLEWTGQYIPSIKENYILDFLEGKKNGRNDYIKGSFLIPKDKENFQVLNKDKNVRDIEEIANPNKETTKKKYSDYYAVVKADGDNIGKVLKNVIGGDFGKLKLFSSFCREYLISSSKIIGQYGGLTVFAGGDDIMFLAPVKCGDRNIFTIISDIREAFDNALKKKIDGVNSLNDLIDNYNKNSDLESRLQPPTLSFGLSIQYVRFPLKEAVQLSGSLLYTAKDNGRNSIAYSLKKNSGQNCQICFNFDGPYFENLNSLIESIGNGDSDDRVLHSILYHLRAGTMDTQANDGEYQKSIYEKIIEHVIQGEFDNKELLLEKVFDNIFDSNIQKQANTFLKKIQKALLSEIPYCDVLQMMWTAKFFAEKRGKEN